MNQRRAFVEVLVLIAIVTCVHAASDGSTSSWLGPDFVVLQKVYDDCYDSNDFTGCLKGKALVALNKAVDQVCVDDASDQCSQNIKLKTNQSFIAGFHNIVRWCIVGETKQHSHKGYSIDNG